jgi:hypothetical protein
LRIAAKKFFFFFFRRQRPPVYFSAVDCDVLVRGIGGGSACRVKARLGALLDARPPAPIARAPLGIGGVRVMSMSSPAGRG